MCILFHLQQYTNYKMNLNIKILNFFSFNIFLFSMDFEINVGPEITNFLEFEIFCLLISMLCTV